jgi:4-hydroxy-2-oxoheptanedioate aldolase
MISNNVKTKWEKKETVLNSFLSIANPFTAEIMSEQGYDALTIDLQHGMIAFNDVLAMLQSIRSSGVTPICRVSGLDHSVISKVMDAGALGVICPMINNRAQAEQLVQDCKYPPIGIRSFGPTRANFTVSSNYFYEANESTFCLAMIETQEAFDNLEEIASTPNLDGLYIGTADLTIGLNKGKLVPGFDRQEPEMIEAKKKILEVAHKHGKVACLHCGTPEYAAKASEWGFDLVTITNDVRLLAGAAGAHVKKFKELTNQDFDDSDKDRNPSSY